MNVIVHYPKSEEAQKELAQKVADIHAEAIFRKLEELTCSKEQINKILIEIKEKFVIKESYKKNKPL